MPRTSITEDQAEDSHFLSEQEHSDIGENSPHHPRGHSFHNPTDHTDVVGNPVAGDTPIYNAVQSKWEFKPAADPLQLTDEPTGFFELSQSTISFNNSNRTLTITPTGDHFIYYIRATQYVKYVAQSVQINNLSGAWFIYFLQGTLIATQTPWLYDPGLLEAAFVAVVIWSVTDQQAVLFHDERHGLVMDWATHERLHMVEGFQVQRPEAQFLLGNYIIRGDGSLNSHAQLSVSNGVVHDEDLYFSVVNSATPTNNFEQRLSTIAYIPMLYRYASGEWRKTVATAFPVADGSGTRIKYNYYNPSTYQWSLEQVNEGYFTVTWLLVTSSVIEPVIGVVDNEQYQSAATAQSKSFDSIKAALPHTEIVALRRLIFRTSSSYTNTPKAVLYAISNVILPIFNTDRYTLMASYGGNAGTGKYLEIFPGISSNEVPFVFPESSFIRTMFIHSAALNTGTMSVYKLTDLVNPILSISLANTDYNKIDASVFLQPNDEICIKVSSGSFNKPAVCMWIQTDIA